MIDRPSDAWTDVITKEYLDLRLEALEERIQRHINRLIIWLVPTVFASLAALGGIIATAG